MKALSHPAVAFHKGESVIAKDETVKAEALRKSTLRATAPVLDKA